jgi:hypothetical protein
MNTIKNQLDFIILYLFFYYQYFKFNVIFFILFTLPNLILIIRIIYFLFIIILLLSAEISNLLFYGNLFNLTEIIAPSPTAPELSYNNFDLSIPTDSADSSISNNTSAPSSTSTSNNFEPNLPNTPNHNPMGSELGVVINQGSSQDNTMNNNIPSNIQSNGQSSLFLDDNDHEVVENYNPRVIDNIQRFNRFIPSNFGSETEDIVGFNEIEYDPQFDDLDFNPCVLYHIDHPFFTNMIYQHILNETLLDLIDIIISSRNPIWDIDSKTDAVAIIEFVLYGNGR